MSSYKINPLIIYFIIVNFIITPEVSLADKYRSSGEIHEIKALGTQWVNLYRSTDIGKFMNQYTENAIVALNGKPALNGKESIGAYFANRIGKKDFDMRLDYEKISINENVAIVVAKFYLSYPSEKMVDTVSGRSLIVYKKSKSGRWLIDVDIDQKTPDAK